MSPHPNRWCACRSAARRSPAGRSPARLRLRAGILAGAALLLAMSGCGPVDGRTGAAQPGPASSSATGTPAPATASPHGTAGRDRTGAPATGPTTPAGPARTAEADLAEFLRRAQRADDLLHAASSQVTAAFTPTQIRIEESTRAAVRAADPTPVAEAIPAGLEPLLLRAVLRVYSDLVARHAAMRQFDQGEDPAVFPVTGEIADRMRECLSRGVGPAARFTPDLAALRTLARSSPPVVVAAATSRQAAELAIRTAFIRLANLGCGHCGGRVELELRKIRWTVMVTAGGFGAGDIDGLSFEVRYTAHAGWDVTLFAC